MEVQREEDQQNALLLKSKRASLKPATSEEIADAEEDDTDYNLQKTLTDLESRVSSLLQSGSEIDMTRATTDQIRNLVLNAKVLAARKSDAAAAAKQQQEDNEMKALEAKQQKEAKVQKEAQVTAANMKAQKFLKKMTSK